MRELHAAIPDPDAVLALEPEELAAKLLFLLRIRNVDPQRPLSVRDLANEVICEDRSKSVEGYPQERWQKLRLAVAEVLAWLEAQGLLIPHPQHGPGFSTLSRRARRFESVEDFRQFELARHLNRDLLHPTIAEEIWLSFVRGRFTAAVFEAMRAVEIAVREAAGFPLGDHGVPMIRRAFHKDTGPLRDPEQEEAERDALAHLFAGAVGSYKNPNSHRAVPIEDAGEAIEIVTLANHLLRIVDARRAAKEARG